MVSNLRLQLSQTHSRKTRSTSYTYTKSITLVLLVSLLTIERPAKAFSAGAAAGGVIGGFIAFLVLAHYVHAKHDQARGEHDLDIDTEYGPAAKRYMHAKVEAQREQHNKHSKHHREQSSHREKRLLRRNRTYTENSN